MVKDEDAVGDEIDQRQRLFHLARQHAEIEGQPGTGEMPDVLAEERALGEIVGHDMQHAAQPLDEGVLPLRLDIGREALLFRTAGGDGAGDQAARRSGEPGDMVRFPLDIAGRDIHFHVQVATMPAR